MPLVGWLTGDTRPNSVVPRLTVGLIEKSRANGRLLNCVSFECEIVNLIPDNVWEEHGGESIGLSEGGLAFVKE
jgi:hypothetical protein